MRGSTLSFALLASYATASPLIAISGQGSASSSASSSAGSSPVGVGVPILAGVGIEAQITGTKTKEIHLSKAFNADVEDADGDLSVDADAEAAGELDLEKRAEVASGTAETFRRATVLHHNFHRFNHSSPAIAWNATLADSAKKIAATCVWAHNTKVDGGGYGQNIAVGVRPKDVSTVISDLFYNGEVRAYKGAFGQMPDINNFEEWGHLTQVVWAGTKSVGCANVDCRNTGMQNWPYKDNAWFTVCNYYPPGNFNNAYAKNVGASLKRDTVTGAKQVNTTAISQGLWPGKNMSS